MPTPRATGSCAHLCRRPVCMCCGAACAGAHNCNGPLAAARPALAPHTNDCGRAAQHTHSISRARARAHTLSHRPELLTERAQGAPRGLAEPTQDAAKLGRVHACCRRSQGLSYSSNGVADIRGDDRLDCANQIGQDEEAAMRSTTMALADVDIAPYTCSGTSCWCAQAQKSWCMRKRAWRRPTSRHCLRTPPR